MEEKQKLTDEEKKASDKALLREVATKLLTRKSLFPRKVASAKAYLKISVFPTEFNSKKD